mmetsp:Transcript_29952/g.85602  ORF Transcript_29952/g.85602 Transcript_29952/m.85602 type:complete len:232 (+) Transcript_29952:4911-5606(+)
MYCLRPLTSYSSLNLFRRSTASRGGMPRTIGPLRSYSARNLATSFLKVLTVLIKSFLYCICFRASSSCRFSLSANRSCQFFWYMVRASISSLSMICGRCSSKIRYMCSIGTNSNSISLCFARTSCRVCMTYDSDSMSPLTTSRNSFFRVDLTISLTSSNLAKASLCRWPAYTSFHLLASSFRLLDRLLVCSISAEIWCCPSILSTCSSICTKYFSLLSNSSSVGSGSLNFL